jgi:hypothetical protein
MRQKNRYNGSRVDHIFRGQESEATLQTRQIAEGE